MHEIRRPDLEACLVELRGEIRDPLAGVHGPGSPAWRLNSEQINFLGAGRAALLQLAHPPVARAIAEHSVTLEDVRGRFRRTFSNVFAMTFGDLESAFRAARRVHNIHTRIRGELDETAGRYRAGDPYAANHADSLRWVYATLVDTVIAVRRRIGRPLSWAGRERYYRDSTRFARLFGLGREAVPASYRGLCEYFDQCLVDGTVAVTRAARDIADSLLVAPSPALEPLAVAYRALTATLLPPALAAAFGLPRERRHRLAASALVAAITAALGRAPEQLRYLPGYLDAEARVGVRWGAARLFDRAAARAMPFWPPL